jgi:hypothetical protein
MKSSRLLPIILILFGACVLGCTKNAAAPCRVSGSLSYKGTPIKAGSMSFVTPDGTSYSAQISTDGTYTATDLPAGEMVVIVNTEGVNPANTAPKGKDAQRRMNAQQQPAANVEKPQVHYVKVPEKYRNAKTSPLTVTLKPGRQVHNIDLED